MSNLEAVTERAEHPLDVIERIAATQEWAFDREQDDEISLSVKGAWADYHVAFTWLDEMEALHIACAFDLKATGARRSETLALIARINEQMWVGHFDLWTKENVVMFRHSLLLTGGAEPQGAQCEALLKLALEACDRHFQAFQFVVWAGKSAEDALEASMFETVGEA
ncbi:MAG: hypothetical protein BGP06_06365 [Rhizobiales bacterium 65-9]|nr:YbjN domain-containing protein [Hyphomicrobiales bacterium]OJY35467.1 MAG: hypothetical protein BGP06_06365 [Rhizobiales bacterium 65-9]